MSGFIFVTWSVLCIHTRWFIVAVDFMFIQPFPGYAVDEDVVEVVLPIMVNIIPSNATLPFYVVVNFSVTGGTATSKDSL